MNPWRSVKVTGIHNCFPCLHENVTLSQGVVILSLDGGIRFPEAGAELTDMLSPRDGTQELGQEQALSASLVAIQSTLPLQVVKCLAPLTSAVTL